MTHTSTDQPEAEKLARIYEGGCDIDKRVAAELRRLHARVQELEASQAQRVPLTDAQIHDWWRSENSLEDCDMCRFADFAQVVRVFELKYGITKEKQG